MNDLLMEPLTPIAHKFKFYLIAFERKGLISFLVVYSLFILPFIVVALFDGGVLEFFLFNSVFLSFCAFLFIWPARRRGLRIFSGIRYGISTDRIIEFDSNGNKLRSYKYTASSLIKADKGEIGDVQIGGSASDFLGSSVFFPFVTVDEGQSPALFVLCRVRDPQRVAERIKAQQRKNVK